MRTKTKVDYKMNLLVQDFLENNTIKDLREKHGVYCSFNKKAYKFSLSYDQIETKDSDLLSQDCRGLILAAVDGRSFEGVMINGRLNYDHICPGKTVILNFGMRRFFNLGQGAAEELELTDPNVKILRKIDGTCCFLYKDIISNEWCIATRSTPEADIPLDTNNGFTFRTLFEKGLFETTGKTFDNFTKSLSTEKSYWFELTSPYINSVIKYKTTSLTYLGARFLTSFNEEKPHECRIRGIPVPKEQSFNDINDLLSWVNSNDPTLEDGEGVVAVKYAGSSFPRVKIKNINYCALHKIKDALIASDRNCIQLILSGKEDDVLPSLAPEIADHIKNMKINFVKMINQYDIFYNEINIELHSLQMQTSGIPSQKDFALLIQNKYKGIWAAPLYQMRAGKCSNMKDFVMNNSKNGIYSDSFLDKILELIKS